MWKSEPMMAVEEDKRKKSVLKYIVFHGELVIRHSQDGKLYLYDVINTKKKRVPV